ncbi:uncharacterized protein Z519_12102 [Cladophialophora bantiana CBS 173.52]|uniref:Azaphilone pigments biosynthesis cluster protein L N-terminal domain-containing protein n=1 Tax=Cladophialophora bantiana (strain ATCC 10958 / CBS 173.52 / CDC B-1940 / NIH 8579) TaxID=1442370 RepID=A0A0D2H8G9_CLAB1|nr:uncharacterized protein Z519_12102 [Cladophialophora bantiana CBS 173.52]KIW87200.1 hypothetical protein Z519_12102 [Cladophialophora bantiana CBS 173.52]
MAEPIGLASGLLALATFAFQSSITLYNTVQSFQSHPARVRDLLEELQALNGVLGPLTETVGTITDVDLSALDLPLLRCGNSCKEFEQEIKKCSSRSGGSRTSFRDWAKLRYMGEDIDGFRRLLAGYKLTINIALTDANLRKSSVTAESLESYKDLIQIATTDLEAHLESIDEKLEIIFKQTMTESDADATEVRLIKEEQLSTQRCLQICAQLSDHINQIQLTPKRSSSSPGIIDPNTFPERVTNVGLEECKNSLIRTAAKLERHIQDLMDRLVTKSKTAMTSEDDIADLARLQEEWETARQCRDICSKADNHLKETISTIDNYATGDAVQFMVSTDGNIIHGTNRGLGWRTRQVGGHLSDLTIQQLSRDMTSISIRNTGNEAPHSGGDSPSVPNDGVGNKPSSDFRERYGRGFKLTSKSTSDATTFSMRSAEGTK